MIDRASVDDMARLMKILSEGKSQPEPARQAGLSTSISPQQSTPVGDPNIDAMRNILERFQSASTTVIEHLVEKAEKNPQLSEALTTSANEHGAQIGNWEIRVNEVGKDRRYDVVNIVTEEPIATNLYLYEAAYGLAKELNRGITVNDRRIKNLLRLEEDFVRFRNDAISMKRRRTRLISEGDRMAAAVAEDRYDEAKRRAVYARQQLQEMFNMR